MTGSRSGRTAENEIREALNRHWAASDGAKHVQDPARGPGRLCTALRIDRRLDGIDLCQAGKLWIGSDGQAADEIGQSIRIGITRAADRPLRFHIRDNRFVSGPRALNR